MLVDRGGDRVCDESRYGAALGDAIVRRGGRAWLLADRATLAEARRQLRGVDAVVPAAAGLVPADRRRGSARPPSPRWRPGPGLDPDRPGGHRWPPTTPRRATRRGPTRRASPPPRAGPQDQPPYSLIDCSVRPRLFYPAPVLTLGGLVVAPGRPARCCAPTAAAVDGLYAAGRSAAGLCSRSYVSGLSLANCVFSGRRAGHHAAKLSPAPRTQADH